MRYLKLLYGGVVSFLDFMVLLFLKGWINLSNKLQKFQIGTKNVLCFFFFKGCSLWELLAEMAEVGFNNGVGKTVASLPAQISWTLI